MIKLEHDVWSSPLESPRLRLLSLGVGVQSSFLLLAADRGEFGPKPDFAIHAVVKKSEPKAVAEYLEYLKSIVSIPIIEVSAGSLRDEIIDATDGVSNASARPPLFVRNQTTGKVGFTQRQCGNTRTHDEMIALGAELVGRFAKRRFTMRPAA